MKLEEEKAKYRLNSQVNKRISQAGRVAASAVPSVGGGVLKEMVTERQEQLQSRLDAQLYQAVIEDCKSIQDFQEKIRHHGSDYTFKKLADGLVDPGLTIESRMEYAKVLALETGKQYQGLSTSLSEVGASLADISEDQHMHFRELSTLSANIASTVNTLYTDLSNTKISIEDFHKSFTQNVDTVAKQMNQHLVQLGRVEMTQNQLLWGQGKLAKSLTHLNKLTDELFAGDIDSIDITEYSNDKNIVQLYQELGTLHSQAKIGLQSQDRVIEKKRELQKSILELKSERISYRNTMATAKSLTSGMANVAILFGNSELAAQIDVLGRATSTIADTALGLLGSSLVASVNPVIGVMNLVGVATSIFNVFGRRRQGPNPHQLILEAINQLAKKMDDLRNEMREQFSEVFKTLDRHHVEVLEKFANLARVGQLTFEKIRLAYMEMHQGFDRIESAQHTILERVNIGHDIAQLQDHRNDIRRLKEESNFIISNPVDKDFRERMNRIVTIGNNNSVSNQLKNPMAIVDLPLNPEYFFHFSTYFSLLSFRQTPLDDSLKAIGNPSLVMLSTLIVLLQNLLKFPKPDNSNRSQRITQSCINQLKELETRVQDIKYLILQCRNRQHLSNTIARYKAACDVLAHEITEQVGLIGQQLQNRLPTTNNPLFTALRKRTLQGFADNKIEHATFNWFNIKRRTVSRSHHKKKWSWPDVTDDSPVGADEKTKYFEHLAKQYDLQKTAAIARANQEEQILLQNRLRVFTEDSIINHHGAGFMRPLDPSMPFLPAPDPLFSEEQTPAFMLYLLRGQALGIGVIGLSYQIENQNFIVNIEFNLLDPVNGLTLYPIASLTRAYQPGIYSGAEAVWNFWMGGELQTQSHGVYYHQANGWQHLLANHTQEQFCKMVSDLALNRGTYGHHSGEYSLVNHAGYLPGPRLKMPEIRLQFENLNGDQLPNEVTCATHDSNIEIVLRRCVSQHNQFFVDGVNQISQQLYANSHSRLGKACEQFESAVRDLYGLLSFAYHDELSSSERPLAQWFAQNKVNLAMLKAYYIHPNNPDSPDVLLRKTATNLTKLGQIISTLHAKYSDDGLQIHDYNFQLLSVTADNLDQFLERYQEFAIEDQNRLDMSESVELHQQFLITIVKGLFILDEPARVQIFNEVQPMLSECLRHKSEDVQNSFVQDLKEAFAHSGILIEWEKRDGDLLRLKYKASKDTNKPHHSSTSSSSSSSSSASSSSSESSSSNSSRSTGRPFQRQRFFKPQQDALAGLIFTPIPHDQDSLFHAIALHLGTDIQLLRQVLSAHLKSSSYFQHFRSSSQAESNQYIDNIFSGIVAGDSLQIAALQRLLDRAIIILHADCNPVIPDNVAEYKEEPIFLYQDSSFLHFDAFVLGQGANGRDILARVQADIQRGNKVTFTPVDEDQRAENSL